MSEQDDHQSSYPPIFRQIQPNTSSPPPSLPDLYPTIDLPVIDLQHLDVHKLVESCKDWGLFLLANHGMPPSLSAELHSKAKKLLSLPFQSKQTMFKDPVTYFWGTPALTLNVAKLNWVEGFHIPLNNQQLGGGGEPDPDAGSFRCLMGEYGRHLGKIGRKLFEAMALDLKLDASRSASYLSTSDGLLRVYRYPPCPDAANYLGMDAHTDSSVLSILDQDEVGGLQVRKDQMWFHVRPIHNTLVVNLGDMMQAISDDKYRSVEHRVLANRSKERISLCYFAFPNEDSVIDCTKYKAFTYKEFRARVQEDIRASGFKVGLDRFRK